MEKLILEICLISLGCCMIPVLILVAKGPVFADRMLCGNALSTMVVAAILLLSRYLNAAYLIDVALIYALLGMLTNVLITRGVIAKRKKGGTAKWFKP